MNERRGSRRGSGADGRPISQRPNSGLFNVMWNKMAEYLEMRTFNDWSSDSEDTDDTSTAMNHGINNEQSSSDESLNSSMKSRNAIANTNSNTHSVVTVSKTEHSKVLSHTSSANETYYSESDSGIESKSGSTSTFNSYTSSTVSSTSSFTSFRDDDFDFIDTLSFQDFDDYEQEYKQSELGEGHSFVPTRLFHVVTWCDKCGDIIWGFHKQCLRCNNCKYTCHFKCYQNGVRLDCSEINEHSSKVGSHDVSPDFTFVSVKDSALTSLSREELLRRTAEYNAEMGQKILKVEPDEGTGFFGPLEVYFNLSRPVSIKSGSPVPTFCNSLKRYDHSVDVTRRRTSFFFPKAQVESLHITSETTSQEVIDCLLKRYKLIDNPHKFALFERTEKDGEVLMRKLEDEDTPLMNVLFWGPNNTEKSMELRENETGIVQWEAFTVPELDNFLKILEKEEDEYIEQVKKKYNQYQTALQDALRSATSPDKEVE
ncbi:ras association domain-containing protein 1-like [Apostichopus japonicus]|uniref:ras association domain-containing protein 1-like n=1 Tax=Stichopus japonicus TaxID=307972 RepID=UPI003AB7B7A0